jgi:putative membrane protein
MHWYGHEFGWGGMVLGGILMLLFWSSFIALIVWVVKSVLSRGNDHTKSGEPNAREILDRRYAQGEISREEYERMKEDLMQ